MARMIVKKKTARVNRPATAAPAADAGTYGDLDNWPRSWMGIDKDLPPGEALLACFRPFIAHLASSSLSRKTIQKHVDNLWLLGGEMIRDLNDDSRLRKVAADRRLRDVIHTDGGPLVHQDSEEAQRSFDSTCRKLHRFLGQPQG
jgi:hypothetical protein